jgi:MFS family permease
MTYRGNPLAEKLDRLAFDPAKLVKAPTFGRKAVLAGRIVALLLLALTLGGAAAYFSGHAAGYSLLVMASPLAMGAAAASPLRQASGSYRPDERERAMQLRAVLWGTGGTLTLGLFGLLGLSWNSLSHGWIPTSTVDFLAITMLLIALPTNIAALAAWLMTSAAGAELEHEDGE